MNSKNWCGSKIQKNVWIQKMFGYKKCFGSTNILIQICLLDPKIVLDPPKFRSLAIRALETSLLFREFWRNEWPRGFPQAFQGRQRAVPSASWSIVKTTFIAQSHPRFIFLRSSSIFRELLGNFIMSLLKCAVLQTREAWRMSIKAVAQAVPWTVHCHCIHSTPACYAKNTNQARE